MPVASSSRRKLIRRQEMSDIEEDSNSLKPTQDDVEESEEQPAQSSKSVAKAKAKAHSRQERNEDPLSDDGDIIDMDNFQDQPLKRPQLDKLNGLAEDWSKVENMIARSTNLFGEIASSLAEYTDEDAPKKKVEEIDALMRSHLDIRAVMKIHESTLQNLRQMGLQGQDMLGVVDTYLKDAKTNIATYNRKTTRQKYAKHEDYITFRSSIWDAQNPGNPMPPVTDSIPREQGDNTDDEDDLEIGGVTQSYTCPLTLTILQDPYVSTVCGHAFSGAAIKATFRNPSMLQKCPAAGCRKSFRLADCKPDPVLAKKVKAHKRRLERAEEDSDAEEVVD